MVHRKSTASPTVLCQTTANAEKKDSLSNLIPIKPFGTTCMRFRGPTCLRDRPIRIRGCSRNALPETRKQPCRRQFNPPESRLGSRSKRANRLCDFMKASAPLDLSKLGSANDQGLGRKGAEMLIIGCDYHPSVQQNRLGRHGDWGMWREAVDAQRWRSRKVLP